MGDLEDLKSIEEIKVLRHGFCFLLDQRNWEDALKLSTNDATADFGIMGKLPDQLALLAL